MPSNNKQRGSGKRKVQLTRGAAPRKASPKPKAWNSGKPPGGKLPPKK